MRTPKQSTRPKRGRAAGALVALALLAAACGSDSNDEASTDTSSAEPAVESTVTPTSPTSEAVDVDATVDTTSADSEVEQTLEFPERVISLSPTHTEIMFAIGAGDLLVAVEEFSNYPAEALELPNDLSGFEPNIESIASFEPDLVLIGGDFNGLGDQLAELGIDWWDGPAASTIDDTYAQIEQIGAAVNRVGEAAELVSSMQTRLDEIIAAAPTLDEPLDVYHEIDSTLFSADSTTFIGEVYAAFGLRNVADRAEGESFGFPQLNPESIIAANPDLIFIPCGTFCTTTADDVASRPGWDTIAAVQNGGVIEVDEDIASRWGPRIVDYYAAVGAAIDQLVTTS